MLALSKLLGIKTAARGELAALSKPANKLGSSTKPYGVVSRAQAGKKQQAS